MGALLEARGIVNRFGAQVVHDGADLTLHDDETLGLVGGSGSGKSVLLRTLLGLNRPAAGAVRVGGRDLYALGAEERKKVQARWGVLFQDGALFSSLNVRDNVAFPLREYSRLNEKDIEARAEEKLDMAGLDSDAGDKRPSDLSGGMVRRAALARALALDPEMLFLDEPTGALDPVAAAKFDELILSLRREIGLGILIITHDLHTLVTVCDRIAMIVDKKIVAGSLEKMRKSDNPAIREFFHGPRMCAVLRGLGREEA
jgi:phospholipid/cholesterol/gamma-HCH transport system ATP-binding protein